MSEQDYLGVAGSRRASDRSDDAGWTYRVDDDGREDGSGNSLAVIRVIQAATELLVTAPVQAGDNAENDNGERGHNGAVRDK